MLIDRETLLDLHLRMRGKIRDAATAAADNPERLSDLVWAAQQARLAGILDGLALAEQAARGLEPVQDRPNGPETAPDMAGQPAGSGEGS